MDFYAFLFFAEEIKLFKYKNELFLAIMFIDKEEARTIPVAMNSFITKYDIDWGAMSAATFLSVIPTLILFAFAQKYIVEGMTQGSVKG
ncbi:hypothetical protein [Neobacillus drentensis]|uniref:hypothetical protein n=1 Tax=Neobacillus drentensis TaxID=220684 RepID=UPI0030026420